MRTVIQRVQHASVTIDGNIKSSIGNGLLLLLGVEEADTPEDVDWLVKKVAALRIFDDENGALRADYSGDGVHVRAPYYVQWRDELYRFGVVK